MVYGMVIKGHLYSLKHFLLEKEHGEKQGPEKQRIFMQQRLSQQHLQDPRQQVQRMLLKIHLSS